MDLSALPQEMQDLIFAHFKAGCTLNNLIWLDRPVPVILRLSFHEMNHTNRYNFYCHADGWHETRYYVYGGKALRVTGKTRRWEALRAHIRVLCANRYNQGQRKGGTAIDIILALCWEDVMRNCAQAGKKIQWERFFNEARGVEEIVWH